MLSAPTHYGRLLLVLANEQPRNQRGLSTSPRRRSRLDRRREHTSRYLDRDLAKRKPGCSSSGRSSSPERGGGRGAALCAACWRAGVRVKAATPEGVAELVCGRGRGRGAYRTLHYASAMVSPPTNRRFAGSIVKIGGSA